MSAVEFIKTKHGVRCLLDAGYKYTLNRRGRDGQCYWRCQDQACPGRATTDENDRLISTSDTHTHQPDQVEVAVAKVIDSISFFQWVPLPYRSSSTPKATVPWPTDWVPDKWLGHLQLFPPCACFPVYLHQVCEDGLGRAKDRQASSS